MKKILLISIVFYTLASCTQVSKQEKENVMRIKYPDTKKINIVENYFGVQVADPYRWLEDDNSEETKAWVKEENKVTEDYLSKIPFRDTIKSRLHQLMNYERQSAPFYEGGKWLFYKNNGLQNQSVLMMMDSIGAEEKILLDPNKLSEDGTVHLSGTALSDDSKYLVYSVARSGSDWNEIYVKDIEKNENIEDHLEWVKFSNIAFFDNGFFYSGYDAPKEDKALTQVNKFHKLFYHKIGTAQSQDIVVIESKTDADLMYTAEITKDNRYLIVTEEKLGTRGNRVLIKDLTKKNADFVAINESFDNKVYFIDNIEDNFFVISNKNAPNNQLLKLKKGETIENAQILIPEKENVLDGVSLVGKKLFINYMKDAHTQMEAYDIEGKSLYEIDLPTVGTASFSQTQKNAGFTFYTFTSFTYPSVVYKYNIQDNKSELYYQSNLDFNFDDYETKQVFYKSKDGTKIPMFIVHKKGLKLNGENPTLLYGYGGFDISLTPSFSTTRLVFLENGGVFAMANLRGGGEYGEKWHQAGTRLNKQNVFDDFIAAAEYLIQEKYTSSNKLAIQGGSNGGLLVGAVTNQRPDLFRVALPAVGVMDMLRYHKFTIGYAWISDYGSSEESKESFENLYKYSPVHNIKDSVDYPAIMVMTADHDDRVVPAHSFKYIATLQEKYKGNNPVLIRIEQKAGHGAGKPIEKIIEEYADIYAFLFYNIGVEPYKK